MKEIFITSRGDIMFERLLELIKLNHPGKNLSNATRESRLREDLGMDSIAMMMLAMSIEEEFGLTFDPTVSFNTVDDVVKYLEENATL